MNYSDSSEGFLFGSSLALRIRSTFAKTRNFLFELFDVEPKRVHGRPSIIPLPFPATNVPAGCTVTIRAQTQVLLRGNNILIPASVAKFFDVLDLRIGKNSQFAAHGSGIPAKSFTNRKFEFDTAQVGQEISIVVTNKGRRAHTFHCALVGRSVTL